MREAKARANTKRQAAFSGQRRDEEIELRKRKKYTTKSRKADEKRTRLLANNTHRDTKREASIELNEDKRAQRAKLEQIKCAN